MAVRRSRIRYTGHS